jgi:hypothetical protein
MFFEGKSPGIVDAEELIVTAKGCVVSTVAQRETPTRFAFEPGSRLRMKVGRPPS